MIAIVDYKAGNTTSVVNAVERQGEKCVVTDDVNLILQADKVILPGVGSAGTAMKRLREKGLDQTILSLEKPILGICLGLQLMCKYSEEDDTECLGIFDAIVRRFPPEDKVPHMGWNNHTSIKGELFKNLNKQEDFYFVHSYYVERNTNEIGICEYITDFASAMNKGNFYGVQFHPEKSASAGDQLIKSFLTL